MTFQRQLGASAFASSMTSRQYVDRAYDRIRAMAISYEIKPDQPIKIEILAQKLNVSVTPVREALNRLLNENLLVRRGTRGFFNRAIDIVELKELFELRGTLLIYAIKLLREKNSNKELREIVSKWQLSCSNSEMADMPMNALCGQLVHLSQNRELERQYNSISDRVSFIWQIFLTMPDAGLRLHQYEEELGRALLLKDDRKYIRIVENGIAAQTGALNLAVKEGLALLHFADPSLAEALFLTGGAKE